MKGGVPKAPRRLTSLTAFFSPLARSVEHGHSPEEIHERLTRGSRPSFLRDWIYGGIDGVVTTFAVVSGVTGAQLSSRVVLIMGFANLLADGFSMAAANFLGTRAEREERARIEAIEQRHIDQFPDGEREEVRQIFRSKGLEGEPLERVVEAITSDREQWIRTMIREEYGLPEEVRSPTRAAASTFAAFMLCGLVPLFPYLLGSVDAFVPAAAASALVFFAIGSFKSLWSPSTWWFSGLETLGLGSVAAGAAYAVGLLLRNLP
jgi:VIT1/CCC1 family predicted Fe2+/Mn2+ transporter